MQTKWILGNVILSVLMFCLIFYLNVGVSGGDIAIVMFNCMFALLQLIINGILLYRSKNIETLKVVIAIIVTNIALIFLFLEYGSVINSWIKSNFRLD
ncbi:hypothetical protein [Flavobacterium sp.]|uniref:hypothetical protein n=1 Tax=Flavobacterium sp. TaxID=239 RepID=UPI0025F20D95|nr:hypothetical protein [Flavobacterium sp.]